MKYLFWISLMLFSLGNVIAQDFQPKGSFKVDVAIPVVLQNKALKKTQQGLLNLGMSYQHAFKGFVIGAGARYNYFNLNEFALQERMQGGLHQIGGFGKIGYERFLSDKLSIDVGVRGGYLQMYSKSTYNDSIIGGTYNNGTWFVEPVAHVSYLASETSAFFFQVAYNIQFFHYGPEYLGIEEIPPYSASDNAKNAQFLTFGFGYSYFFGRGKKNQGR